MIMCLFSFNPRDLMNTINFPFKSILYSGFTLVKPFTLKHILHDINIAPRMSICGLFANKSFSILMFKNSVCPDVSGKKHVTEFYLFLSHSDNLSKPVSLEYRHTRTHARVYMVNTKIFEFIILFFCFLQVVFFSLVFFLSACHL